MQAHVQNFESQNICVLSYKVFIDSEPKPKPAAIFCNRGSGKIYDIRILGQDYSSE